jgi:hypothetical protein
MTIRCDAMTIGDSPATTFAPAQFPCEHETTIWGSRIDFEEPPELSSQRDGTVC